MPPPQAAPSSAATPPSPTAANQVTIDQTSDRAIIDWDSFNIDAGDAARFNQPGAGSWTLNRDLQGSASQILGSLSANGNIVIQNRHGVFVGPGARVDVNSIVATSLDITNQNFMDGRMIFDIPGESDAVVANHGEISVGEGGLAALVAPGVENAGVINARLGTVALAAGNTATLDFYGDGLLSIAVTSPVTETPVGPDGQPVDALVNHTGEIYADGGTVVMTAAQVEGVLVSAINLGRPGRGPHHRRTQRPGRPAGRGRRRRRRRHHRPSPATTPASAAASLMSWASASPWPTAA